VLTELGTSSPKSKTPFIQLLTEDVIKLALQRKYPCVADMETAARKRLPRFIWDYLYCGMGHGDAVRRNHQALDSVKLVPDYLVPSDTINLETNFLGKTYSAPFGVAPVGLGGIAWPLSAEYLAQAAQNDRIPFCASTFAMTSLETLRDCAGEYAWFQLYLPNQRKIEDDILKRARDAGYQNLIVTVDVPHAMRRDHDIRNGFSIPVKWNLQNLFQIAAHPGWAFAMARSGFPVFQNLTRYVPHRLSSNDSLDYLGKLTVGHITQNTLERLRDNWKGNILVKGVLGVEDALICRKTGMDGIIVSNHGGRQLEAAPAPADILPQIRKAVGPDYSLIADGGVRNGLDIYRLINRGANLVLLGRAYYYAVVALGKQGPSHLNQILREELRAAISQLGLHAPHDTQHIQ
jgi:L-lactate dehydrogenase (cytochrome)